MQAEIGVIGGSGFYSLLHDVHEISVDTPFGEPSSHIFIAEHAGKKVAFLPRHGPKHPFRLTQLITGRTSGLLRVWGLDT